MFAENECCMFINKIFDASANVHFNIQLHWHIFYSCLYALYHSKNCVCARARARACVCVCVRERERERVCVRFCVCACMCV